jgi:hypothetical protein
MTVAYHFETLRMECAILGIHSKFWKSRMASSGMLRRVALVITDVSEELSASFIRVIGIGELGITLVPPKRRFLQEPHGITSQKMPFFVYEVLNNNIV